MADDHIKPDSPARPERGLNCKKKSPSARGTGHASAGVVLGTGALFGHLAFFLFVGGMAAFR